MGLLLWKGRQGSWIHLCGLRLQSRNAELKAPAEAEQNETKRPPQFWNCILNMETFHCFERPTNSITCRSDFPSLPLSLQPPPRLIGPTCRRQASSAGCARRSRWSNSSCIMGGGRTRRDQRAEPEQPRGGPTNSPSTHSNVQITEATSFETYPEAHTGPGEDVD